MAFDSGGEGCRRRERMKPVQEKRAVMWMLAIKTTTGGDVRKQGSSS